MSQKQGSSKKSRTSRKSAGERRSSAKVRLTNVQKALINGVHYVPLPSEKRTAR